MSGGITATTAISIGLAVASAAAGAATAIMSGQAAKKQADYQAQVAKNNQIIANQNAQDALDRGKIEADQQRKKTAAVIGSERAALAAQGADVNSGTALDIQTDAAASGKLDELTIRNNAAREARQFQVEGMNDQAQAGLYQMQGSNAVTSSYLNAGSSLLSSASWLSGKWNTIKQTGA